MSENSQNFKIHKATNSQIFTKLITCDHFRTYSNILSREHGGLVVDHHGFDPHVHWALCCVLNNARYNNT